MSAVTVDQPTIDRLLGSPIAKMLPCLASPPREWQSPCGGCTTSSSLDYNKIKACLSSSSAGDLSLIKQELGATKLRFKTAITKGGQPSVQTIER